MLNRQSSRNRASQKREIPQDSDRGVNRCPPGRHPTLTPVRPRSAPLAARIAYHEAALRALRRQQRDALVVIIATIIGPGVAFSARELFAHRAVSRELGAAFEAAGITNARKLGKRLRQ